MQILLIRTSHHQRIRKVANLRMGYAGKGLHNADKLGRLYVCCQKFARPNQTCTLKNFKHLGVVLNYYVQVSGWVHCKAWGPVLPLLLNHE